MAVIETQKETAKERKRAYDASRLAIRREVRNERSQEQQDNEAAWHKRRLQNPDVKERQYAMVRERQKNIRSNRDTWPIKAVSSAKCRAKAAGLPFDISPEDVVVPVRCPIRGVEILFGAGRNNPDNPSLDRVIPELGYVRGNVRVISYWANRIKCDCSDAAVFRRLADYVEGRL